jgi:benzoyl-CoA 2,3-dioxygenase component B
LTADEWDKQRDQWLPSESDAAYVETLMKPVYERGKIAAWIAPPAKGINGQAFEFEYVRLS